MILTGEVALADAPLLEMLDSTRRLAVVEALMLATHGDLSSELAHQIDTLSWLCLVLGATEREVQPDVDKLLAKLGTDRKAWDELEPIILELQRTAVKDSP